ncbi:MAG: hypothetical protein R3B06_02255 [Kofleriaceae bacterium]
MKPVAPAAPRRSRRLLRLGVAAVAVVGAAALAIALWPSTAGRPATVIVTLGPAELTSLMTDPGLGAGGQDGPLAQPGLLALTPADVIVAVDGRPTPTPAEARRALRAAVRHAWGDPVAIEARRAGRAVRRRLELDADAYALMAPGAPLGQPLAPPRPRSPHAVRR